MTSGWMIVAAGLGSAALTGLIGLGLFWLQGRRQAKAMLWQSRRSAYSRLLARTGALAHTADALRITVESESGVLAGARGALGIGKPVRAMELAQFLRHDVDGLYEAWGEVSTSGSPEAVRLGNAAVEAGGALVAAASVGTSQPGAPANGATDTIALQDERRALSHARRRFMELARRELGLPLADLTLSDTVETGEVQQSGA